MAQGVLPFQYEVEKRDGGMTGVAGLPLYVEFAHVMGLPGLIGRHVRGRSGNQGWTDEQIIMALVWLNLRGGDCVDDLRALEGDEGFCRVVRDLERFGRTRSEQRALKRRWGKKQTRTFPSPTVAREYLELFHNTEQEGLRREHEAFIPEHSAMKRLVLGETWVNRRLKAIRFWLIKIPGRVLRHARSLIVRLVGGHPSNEILRGSRGRMLRLCDSG